MLTCNHVRYLYFFGVSLFQLILSITDQFIGATLVITVVVEVVVVQY